mgnify:CR=1 FL=1
MLKRIGLTFIILIMMVGCYYYKAVDFSKVNSGMSKKQVTSVIGELDKIGLKSYAKGTIEVSAKYARGNRAYLLFFLNQKLIKYKVHGPIINAKGRLTENWQKARKNWENEADKVYKEKQQNSFY